MNDANDFSGLLRRMSSSTNAMITKRTAAARCCSRHHCRPTGRGGTRGDRAHPRLGGGLRGRVVRPPGVRPVTAVDETIAQPARVAATRSSKNARVVLRSVVNPAPGSPSPRRSAPVRPPAPRQPPTRWIRPSTAPKSAARGCASSADRGQVGEIADRGSRPARGRSNRSSASGRGARPRPRARPRRQARAARLAGRARRAGDQDHDPAGDALTARPLTRSGPGGPPPVGTQRRPSCAVSALSVLRRRARDPGGRLDDVAIFLSSAS